MSKQLSVVIAGSLDPIRAGSPVEGFAQEVVAWDESSNPTTCFSVKMVGLASLGPPYFGQGRAFLGKAPVEGEAPRAAKGAAGSLTVEPWRRFAAAVRHALRGWSSHSLLGCWVILGTLACGILQPADAAGIEETG